MRKAIFLGAFVSILMLFSLHVAADDGLLAWWKLDEGKGKTAIDSISQKEDTIFGNFWYVPGVSGTGVKFDGFTTHIIRKAGDVPRFTDAFSVGAWVAPQAYPWNWCAIVNQEKDRKKGYFFGIDELGHVGLELAVDGEWKQCTTEERIRFMTEWAHIAATFDKDKGIAVYINGKKRASLPVKGRMDVAENIDLQIGRNLTLLPPAALVRPEVSFPSSYSFDGIIDEVKIYERALTRQEIMNDYQSSKPKTKPALEWRKLPEIPPGPKRFGAYYTKLKFYKEWDELWRVSDHPDVVVNFDEGPYHMVFWRGTNFNMNLVAENGRWVGDQSAEGGGGDVVGCCEHMSDKQCRYAHVRIIENNDARVVVHWRYALCDVRYRISGVDPLTGWGNWADEYYYIYPDGVAVRHFIIHGRDPGYSITEPATLNQPGEKAEDNVFLDAITMANLNGEFRTYTWDPWPGPGGIADNFYNPLANPTLCKVNLKSGYKPFYIYEPGTRIIPYGGGLVELREEYSRFPTWNHWPVSLVPCDGRFALAPDRVSSSAITSPEPPMERNVNGDLEGRFIMGLSNKPIEDLIPLARSWLNAPQLKIHGKEFVSEGYSRDQRAYILARQSDTDAPLEFTLVASDDSPVVNPTFIIENWGDADADLKIDGRNINPGQSFRFGHRYTLEGGDLVVWLKTESAKPVEIFLSPAAG